MKSKTKIKKQTRKKTNPELIKTVFLANKNKAWHNIAELLSAPRRKKIIVNLEKIDQSTKEGDTIIIPGKVLSSGNISKKLRVVALSFSEEAKQKLKAKKCEVASIKEEIKINPKANGIKVIK